MGRMNLLEALPSPRFKRRFSPGIIDERSMRLLIDAALAAPFLEYGNQMAFLVAQKSSVIQVLSEKMKAMGGRDETDIRIEILSQAKNMIWICSKSPNAVSVDDGQWAAHHLMLAAYQIGISAVSFTVPDSLSNDSEIRQGFGFPVGYHPLLPIIVGYAEHQVHRPIQRHTMILNWIK